MDLKEKRESALELLKQKQTIYIGGKLDQDLEDIVLECLSIALVKNYKEITIIFNSNGGLWETGVAIHNAILLLDASGTVVRGIVISRCCSATIAIFQACSTREVMVGSHIIMHWGRSSLSNTEQAALRHGDTKWVVRQINDANNEMVTILASRSLIIEKELAKMCDREERISATRAVKLGLADRVINDKTVMTLFKQAERTKK